MEAIRNGHTLLEIVRSHARRAPQRTAFTFLRGDGCEDDRVTFGQLDADARCVAAKLRAGGMRGERALLLYPPGIDFVRALLGCFYAGAIAVPAPPLRARTLDERTAGIITDASVRTVMGLERQLAQLKDLDSKLRVVPTDESRNAASVDVGEAANADAHDVAFLQYTSGSTGRPKGVVVTHANVVENLRLMQSAWSYSHETVFVSWLPHFHDMGLIGNILQAIFMGSHCVLMSPAAFLQDPARWLRAITRYRGSASGAPNFAFELCATLDESKKVGLDLSSWEVAVKWCRTRSARDHRSLCEGVSSLRSEGKCDPSCLWTCGGDVVRSFAGERSGHNNAIFRKGFARSGNSDERQCWRSGAAADWRWQNMEGAATGYRVSGWLSVCRRRGW